MTETNKKKQKYLQQYQWAKKEIDNWKNELNQWLVDEIEKKTEELDRWKSKTSKLTAIITDMPTGGESLGMDGAVVNYLVLEKELDDNIIKAMDEKRGAIEEKINGALATIDSIERSIEDIDDGRLRMILKLRYCNCYKWEEICCHLSYSWKMVHLLHCKGLEELKMEVGND